ncbi:hypothetical protein [Streptomyces sp. NBC_01171]|uniref:hypothetical protein n=1 Tax=Streptomyces sp. NBC_01171 TaxID=2903757 RepID=UPI00386D5216|nr:hypothetical protein OG448_29780 [Streptomyces sp. NBC_01171]
MSTCHFRLSRTLIVTKGITLITESDERVVVKEERVKLLETLDARVASLPLACADPVDPGGQPVGEDDQSGDDAGAYGGELGGRPGLPRRA